MPRPSRTITLGKPYDTQVHFEFNRGEVISVQTVGDYHIIEYHPFGPQDRAAKSWYEKDEVTYRDVVRYEVYRTGVTGYPEGIFRPFAIFDTLDAALANAIAVKHDGTGTRADQYFMRSIWLGEKTQDGG